MKRSPFLESIYRDMTQKGYAKRTVEAYIYWIKYFINFHKQQHPSQLHNYEVKTFLSFLANEKKVVYDTMLDKMKEAIAMGQNLVLDATFHKKETRDTFMKQLSDQGEVFFIGLHSAESTIRERLKKSRTYSEADFEVYKLIQQQWEPFNEHHLVLESTNNNIEEMLLKAAQYLGWKNDTGTDK